MRLAHFNLLPFAKFPLGVGGGGGGGGGSPTPSVDLLTGLEALHPFEEYKDEGTYYYVEDAFGTHDMNDVTNGQMLEVNSGGSRENRLDILGYQVVEVFTTGMSWRIDSDLSVKFDLNVGQGDDGEEDVDLWHYINNTIKARIIYHPDGTLSFTYNGTTITTTVATVQGVTDTIIFGHDGTNMWLNVNDYEVGSTAVSQLTDSAGSSGFLNSQGSQSCEFWVDEYMVWTKTLNSLEITALQTAGRFVVDFMPFTSSVDGFGSYTGGTAYSAGGILQVTASGVSDTGATRGIQVVDGATYYVKYTLSNVTSTVTDFGVGSTAGATDLLSHPAFSGASITKTGTFTASGTTAWISFLPRSGGTYCQVDNVLLLRTD